MLGRAALERNRSDQETPLLPAFRKRRSNFAAAVVLVGGLACSFAAIMIWRGLPAHQQTFRKGGVDYTAAKRHMEVNTTSDSKVRETNGIAEISQIDEIKALPTTSKGGSGGTSGKYLVVSSGYSWGPRCNAADGWPASFCQGDPCRSSGCTSPASSPLACKAACDSSSECTGFLHNALTPWNDGSWCVMYHEAGGTPGFGGVTYNGIQKWGVCHYHVSDRNGGNAIDVPSSATPATTYQSYTCYKKDETVASGECPRSFVSSSALHLKCHGLQTSRP